MKRALVVTCSAPVRDPESCVHGVFQRFAALLAAVVPLVERVEVIALYRQSDASSVRVTAEELQQYYRAFAGVDVDVRILVVPSDSTSGSGRLATFVGGFRDPYGVSGIRSPGADWSAQLNVHQHDFDFVIIHRLVAFANFMQLARPNAPIVLDLDDVEHRAALRTWALPPRHPGKIFEFGRVLGLLRLEQAAVRHCSAVFVCSEIDRRIVSRLTLSRRVHVLPNTVETRADLGPTPDSKIVLFVGVLEYLPNADAARWLINDIWPRVLSQHPDARLRIAGRLPKGGIPDLVANHSSVEILGFVDDLDAEYRQAHVVACPIRAGGGTRIKIIEAAMNGRAVVSTRIGAEGLAFAPHHEIMIADTSQDIADAVSRLLASPQLCDEIATTARTKANSLYSRSAFSTIVQQCVNSARSGSHRQGQVRDLN